MRISGETVSLSEALQRLDHALSGLRLPSETVRTEQAAGRVLARAERSRLDLPPFDRATVDGYALPAGGPRESYRLAGSVAAGEPARGRLRPGTAVKVMTGAPVPAGTARVAMLEDAEEEAGLVRFRRLGSENICWKGEDLRRRQVVLERGTPLRPLDVANLIACGIPRVEVARRPRCAILTTGDELVENPERLRPGRIMNSNGPLLAGLAAAHGLEVVLRATVPDRPAATERAIREALRKADLTILTGGVSVGERDHVLPALARLGLDVRFSRVAVKPGRPMTFAARGRRLVFGLPGNPVAVFVSFHLYVLRAARSLQGAGAPLREVLLPLAGGFRRHRAGRAEFVPARLLPEGRVSPIPIHGSAHLLSLTDADGFLIVPEGATEIRAGTPVSFLLPAGGFR